MDQPVNRSVAHGADKAQHLVPAPDAAQDPDVRRVPVQDLSVRVQDTPGRKVDLQFSASGGEVRVTMLTRDPSLSSAIRTELPRFESGLRAAGWTSGFWTVSAAAAASDGPAAGAGGGAQQQPGRHRPDWELEAEERLNASALRRLAGA
jgi:hypothetical protein